jgi:hypothetical protein
MLSQRLLGSIAQRFRGKQSGQFCFLLTDEFCQIGYRDVPLVRVQRHVEDFPAIAQTVAPAKNTAVFRSKNIA